MPRVKRDHTDLFVGQFSMQFSDTRTQKEHDAEVIFARGYDWIWGTEAGEEPLASIIRAAAKRHGYRIHFFLSNWIAVKASLIVPGTWRAGGRVVVETKHVAGPGHHSNVVRVRFRMRHVGRVHLFGSHYPTKGRFNGKGIDRRNIRWTRKIARTLGSMARRFGAGTALVFYGGDQNMDDKVVDTFDGQPLTSVWDELGIYAPTHWSTIDVIASYNGDGRVSALSVKVPRLHLNTDHRGLEAWYRVRNLARR